MPCWPNGIVCFRRTTNTPPTLKTAKTRYQDYEGQFNANLEAALTFDPRGEGGFCAHHRAN